MEKEDMISSALGLSEKDIEFCDYNYKKDNQKFFDEILIDRHPDLFATKCSDCISTFWTKFLDLYSAKDKNAKNFFENLKEINWTCIGYTDGEPAGTGVSGKLSKDIFKKIDGMLMLKKAKIHHLVELEIFVNQVNTDRISDVITSIILLPLSKYTHRMCKKYKLQKFLIKEKDVRVWDKDNKMWIKTDIYLLNINGRKRLLYPKNIVSNKTLYKKENFFGTFMTNEIKKMWIKEKRCLVKQRKFKNQTIDYIPNDVFSDELNKCIKKEGLESKREWIIKMFNDEVFDPTLIVTFWKLCMNKK